MLKSISLENYKCFKEKTDIEIAPLTVLCGVNSSGKSSILKSLLMLKQTAESKLSEPLMLLSGDLVDCGTFDDILNYKVDEYKKYFLIKNKFVINNHKLSTTGKFIKRQDAKEFNELEKIYACVDQTIVKFIFDVTIQVEKYSDSENEFSPYLSNNRIKSYFIFISVEGENGIIPECSGNISFRNTDNFDTNNEIKESHNLSWNTIPNLNKREGKYGKYGNFSNYKCSCTFNGLAISNVFAYDMKYLEKNILRAKNLYTNQFMNQILYVLSIRLPIKKNVFFMI